jgi:hypothetical protein
MAETLVLDVCARRLSAAGDFFVGYRYDQGMHQHAPGFPTVSIALRIDFPLPAIGVHPKSETR